MTGIGAHLATGAELGEAYRRVIRVQATPDAVFDALTTVRGLSSWWTRVAGSGDAGGELKFSFAHPDPCVMRVDEAIRPRSVTWTVTSCDFLPDWVGTRPSFTIDLIEGDACALRFHHQGLTAELDCIEQCSSGWDHFLESLGQYVESGSGMPHGSPEDAARRRSR